MKTISHLIESILCAVLYLLNMTLAIKCVILNDLTGFVTHFLCGAFMAAFCVYEAWLYGKP